MARDNPSLVDEAKSLATDADRTARKLNELNSVSEHTLNGLWNLHDQAWSQSIKVMHDMHALRDTLQRMYDLIERAGGKGKKREQRQTD